mgnify:FL=1
MHRVRTASAAAAAMLLAAGPAWADSGANDHGHDHEHAAVDHFEGKPARDLEQAVANLRAYSKKLESRINGGELSAADMREIHSMSYTLENALARLDQELDHVAENLEAVHLASERQDRATVTEKGRVYVQDVNLLLNGVE